MAAGNYNGVVIAGHVRSLLDYLRAHKHEPARIYPLSLLAAIESGDARTRIPLADWEGMFERAIAATGDPALPLRVGASISTSHYGVVGYTIMSCATLGEAIAMMGRYERVVDDVNESELVLRGGEAALHWLPQFEYRSSSFAQLSLAGWVTQMRQLTARPELPAHADFQFARPREVSAYETLFGGRVRFGQKVTRLAIPAQYLQLPVVYSDPQMRKQLKAQADALLREVKNEPTFLHELRTELSRSLASGEVTLEAIAQRLHVSPRTLQRRLEELKLSFREVLDQVRCHLAETHLKNPQLSLAEIAFLLGYSEQSPFQHAFRRWLGTTPAAYRRELMGV